MALRARLSAPQDQQATWPWHHAKWTALPAGLLFSGDRRMEAESYLAGGYGLRVAFENRRSACLRFGELARVWQPPRLKGTLVSPDYGTPFLAATQVFDLRPTPRKWLAVEQIRNSDELLAAEGTILVTRSGSVGRATLAHRPHEGVLLSDDLLRVEARAGEHWGWLYAFLRSPQAFAMMNAARYGHVVKHLEVAHLNALPIPLPQEQLLRSFDDQAKALLTARNRVHDLIHEAEAVFASAIGEIRSSVDPEKGFEVRAGAILGGRRRLEASYYNPAATEILRHFNERGLVVEPLSQLSKRVWWLPRFKRVFGDGGVPYMSADELFSLNPQTTKRVLLEQATHAQQYFVRSGWIVMACSGQVYGLNGSVALITERHEKIFFSHDLIRIAPREGLIRPGYLFTALGHPRLGRPLVIRCAYGTSIPHLDPDDVAAIPVVRLPADVENKIADLVEEAVRLRAEADELENTMAADAEELIDRFLAGDTASFQVGRGD